MITVPDGVPDFAVKRLRHDPTVRIEDSYKWLYQATRGTEHAVTDEKMARAYLQREWVTLGEPLPNEPLWEPLREDEKLGRLNLRVFRARGGKLEDVVTAFTQSSKEFKDNENDFRAAWKAFGLQLAHEPFGELTRQEWRRLDEAMLAKNYPPIHHSDAYAKARRPAYRVITLGVFKKLRKTLRIGRHAFGRSSELSQAILFNSISSAYFRTS